MLFRRFVYHALSVCLFVFLILAAWSAALTITFSNPAKLETWLSQSKLYDHFVATAIEQTQKSAQKGQNNVANGLDVNDPAVQDAAKAAITPEVLQKSVNTFLDANYAWLEGKTAKPEFSIDLTGVKSALAANIGAYAQKRATGLPKCTNIVQIAQQTDYLTATCLPPGVTPSAVAQAVQQQTADSQDFLANPVITAETFNQTTQTQQGSQTSQKPYYQQLSSLPAAYRISTKIPVLVTVLAILSIVGVTLLAATRRKGLRRVASLLVSTGAIILLLIFISSAILHRVETKVFTNDKVGQLQQSLVDFAHRAQSALANIDLWFGVSFVAAGAAIYLALYFTKPKAPKPTMPEVNNEPPAPTPPAPKRPTLIQL
ncbi:MAG TPA: hypothetical protein VFI84_03345 [Candidatus Saccharimonadales bacterium]|nr:hypothetical protein [Candidatus Saccharimonadales bacterium]